MSVCKEEFIDDRLVIVGEEKDPLELLFDYWPYKEHVSLQT